MLSPSFRNYNKLESNESWFISPNLKSSVGLTSAVHRWQITSVSLMCEGQLVIFVSRMVLFVSSIDNYIIKWKREKSDLKGSSFLSSHNKHIKVVSGN